MLLTLLLKNEVHLIYKVVLESGVQQVIQLSIYTFFQILFHYRLLLDTEYSFLCYIVGPLELPS